jgi:osmotically-inducible protein OsmY
MADNNRNQQFDQSSSGWDQNRRRFDQESDYNRNRENYGSFGNTGMGDEWNRSGQGGYSGTSGGYGSQGNRSSMSDYDDRGSSYGNQGWSDRSRNQDTGNMGGNRQSGSDYRSSGSGGSMSGYGGGMGSGMDMGRGMSGGMGNRESWQDQNSQRSNYGGGYGRDERQGYGGGSRGSDYRGNSDAMGNQYSSNMGDQNMGGRTYGELYGGNLEERERMTNQARGGRENIMANRSGQDRMYGGMRDEDWRSRQGGSGYGQMSGGGYSDWNRSSGMGSYGGGRGRSDWDRGRRDYDRGDSNHDRSWWDKTRDEVSSWFGDDEAERRRLMDERRSESYRGKGPRDYKRSDDRIREDVCDRLSDDPFIDASDIDVRVEGSEVILSGRVESREAKRRAEDMVESISGVSNVQNQLKVSRDSSGTMGSTGTTGGMGSTGSSSSTDSTRAL